MFLSKKCDSYLGFCRAQPSRTILMLWRQDLLLHISFWFSFCKPPVFWMRLSSQRIFSKPVITEFSFHPTNKHWISTTFAIFCIRNWRHRMNKQTLHIRKPHSILSNVHFKVADDKKEYMVKAGYWAILKVCYSTVENSDKELSHGTFISVSHWAVYRRLSSAHENNCTGNF